MIGTQEGWKTQGKGLRGIASMVCFLAWNWAMKELGEVAVTNYVYFNPVTTVLFAWLVLSERITLYL